MEDSLRHQSKWQYSRLLVDAEAFFQSILDAINGARHSVDLEYYIFQLDVLGEQFLRAMSEAALRGVRVRLLIDGVGSGASRYDIVKRLVNAGVAVKIYHPLPWLTAGYRWSSVRGGILHKFLVFLLNINRRNHRKLAVVDRETAWVGSFNISADHLPDEAGGRGWRDYGVQLRGPEVESLVSSFELIWAAEDPRFHRGFIARYLSNRSMRARRLKNRFVARKVARAQRRVWLVAAYFAPTASMRRALLRSCRDGREVRLLLPEKSDVAIFPGLSSHYFLELLQAGARIYRYREGILHAKALLVDDFAIVGSSNWNYRSNLHDLELDAIIREPDTLAELESVIEADFDKSSELLLDDAPPVSLVSWLWYALRYWM